tara:strand:- start:264 stop:557 length:294 start_codon:yes stop_codon:yes gene_type:complete
MENKDTYYKGSWHAFYSATSIESTKNDFYTEEEKKHKKRKVYTNFYKNNKTGKEIEITSVYSTEKYPNYKDCPYYFEDKIYLGIVNNWARVGQYEKF